ncbi:MAG: RsmE family RNA methyltransferase, partial [bacterium]
MKQPEHAVTHFYVEPKSIAGDTCLLDSEESKHLAKVMRAEVGEEIKVTDGLGNLYTVRLETISEKQTSGKIIYRSSRVNELETEVTVGFGLLTGTKTEQ